MHRREISRAPYNAQKRIPSFLYYWYLALDSKYYNLPGKRTFVFCQRGTCTTIQEYNFHRGKSRYGMQLAHPGFVSTRSSKKVSKISGCMLKNSRNAVSTKEKAPAGCSELAKSLENWIPSKSNLKWLNFNVNLSKIVMNQGFGN